MTITAALYGLAGVFAGVGFVLLAFLILFERDKRRHKAEMDAIIDDLHIIMYSDRARKIE